VVVGRNEVAEVEEAQLHRGGEGDADEDERWRDAGGRTQLDLSGTEEDVGSYGLGRGCELLESTGVEADGTSGQPRSVNPLLSVEQRRTRGGTSRLATPWRTRRTTPRRPVRPR
jgi:hypothetical protein